METEHRSRFLFAAALVVLIAGFWFVSRPDGPLGQETPRTEDFVTPEPTPALPAEPRVFARPEAAATVARPAPLRARIVTAPEPSRSPMADALNAPNTSIRGDLEVLANVLTNYRWAIGGNPTGNNAEITAQLTGGNERRHAPIPAGHPAIDDSGRLLDRWGTPFFFHALSARYMAIRSAGPDREMFTADDIDWSPLPESSPKLK